MSKLIILTHEFDTFRFPGFLGLGRRKYLMQDIAHILRDRGHKISVCRGIAGLESADMLIAHVDCTTLSDAYRDAIQKYPVTINGNVHDINKRSFSKLVLSQTSDWTGAVLVKSALNFRGLPEEGHNKKATKARLPLPHPVVKSVSGYDIYDSLAELPSAVWQDHSLVVEKFMPEELHGGFGTRNYVFAGTYERCTLHVSNEKIVKGKGVFHSEPVDIPDEIRQIRRDMGFDYGKFDFVVSDGKTYLLDANKTMGGAKWNAHLAPIIATQNSAMADAFEAMLP